MEIYISRYNPEIDKKPYLKRYELDVELVKGSMLLHALEYLKESDGSLTFRRSCGSGVCGSDGMNINGKNGLACMTLLSSLPDSVTIRPLPSMPIIRDLVVDLGQFYQSYKRIHPYIRTNKELSVKEMHQTIVDREKLDGLYECIMCACCSTMCPSYWWNPDKFIGPAGLLTAARFVMDSRDDTKQERLADLDDLFKLYRCRSILNCTDVCPKGLNPNAAIAKIRVEMLQSKEEGR